MFYFVFKMDVQCATCCTTGSKTEQVNLQLLTPKKKKKKNLNSIEKPYVLIV